MTNDVTYPQQTSSFLFPAVLSLGIQFSTAGEKTECNPRILKILFILLLTTFSEVNGFLFFYKEGWKNPASSWNTYHQYLGCISLKTESNSHSISYNRYQSEGCRAVARACLHMQHQVTMWSAVPADSFPQPAVGHS